MEKSKIDRINFLARKSKTEPLSVAELAEQADLRREYLAEFRASFSAQLENTLSGSVFDLRARKFILSILLFSISALQGFGQSEEKCFCVFGI